MPTTLVAPVAPKYCVPAQEPAVPLNEEPTPRPNHNLKLQALLVAQVPVVSPAIVTVFFSQVSADEIVYVNG